MANTRSLSVQKHRTKMAAEGYARMEVTLGAWLITKARKSAQRSRWPLWKVMEDALIAHLKADHAAETDNAK